MTGNVKIINFNTNAHNIVSAAGRISTTSGTANEVYQKSCDNEEEKNLKLISKILSSGHESVLEHIYVNLSFDSVSVYVEQFLIEFRLASFTVKSRRYVDFGNMGYILPASLENTESEDIKTVYQSHMEFLFDEYNYFVNSGIPKEDARFVLPYSFRSNFYCTVNARELVKIMNEMVYGRGKKYPELVELGKSLFDQCEQKLPYLNIKKNYSDSKESLRKYLSLTSENKITPSTAKNLVTLLSGTAEPEKIICSAAALNCGISNWADISVENTEQQKMIISELLKGGRKRELEQANFTICFNKMSLSGVTHLVRHRMQSIVIPKYIYICNFDEYVLPESIVKAGFETRYRYIFQKTKEVANSLKEKGFCQYDQVYMLLSGMTIPVMTTMNANELNVFLKLRTCNRAQWEIKECADELLTILRKEYPVLFSAYGPSCFVTGKCPEGKMTCGMMLEMCQKYGDKRHQ